ncbi:MAG: PAS domain S-box protein, partial [Silvanigrellaceae bacterium]|nr:PAS domain S-box protein [Silvanigrellaceae bacterium]
MDKKNEDEYSSVSMKKIVFGYVSLIIIFFTNMIFTLVISTQRFIDLSEIRDNLSFLTWVQSSLLIVSSFFVCFITYFWVKREQNERRLSQELLATYNAIAKSQAIIEFNLDGTITSANEKFLDTVGYTLEEIVGKHHSIFVEKETKNSPEYMEFWKKLNRGEYEQGEYKRAAKEGRDVWLLSSYNPILNARGKPIKVIEVATDITERKQKDAELLGLTYRLQQIGEQIVIDSNEISTGVSQL